jgi:TonB family protein
MSAITLSSPAWADAAPVPAPPLSVPANLDGLVPAGQLRSRPVFISGTAPDEAPEVLAAAKLGRFGKVVAQATVMADGSLADIVILEPSGAAPIDAAVVRALKTWNLSSPVDKAGVKVATRAKFPFALGHFPNRITGSEPAFPEAAKAAFHNGKVVISGRIDPDGQFVEAKVTKSSKSDLLDGAALAALAASRFERPIDLAGNPTSFDASFEYKFSQAEAGGGSYISGLKGYKCSTFIGETDWWTQANPGAKPSNQEFYTFMAGLAFIAPEALGWGKPGLVEAMSRHPFAWQHALAECRTKPDSTFLEQYRQVKMPT